MIIAYPFIQRVKLGMTYTDDARIVSSNIICHHEPRAWEQVVGSKWWEIGHTRKPQAYEGHTMK